MKTRTSKITIPLEIDYEHNHKYNIIHMRKGNFFFAWHHFLIGICLWSKISSDFKWFSWFINLKVSTWLAKILQNKLKRRKALRRKFTNMSPKANLNISVKHLMRHFKKHLTILLRASRVRLAQKKWKHL